VRTGNSPLWPFRGAGFGVKKEQLEYNLCDDNIINLYMCYK